MNQKDEWLMVLNGCWHCSDRLGGHTSTAGIEMAAITLQRDALILNLFIL